LRGGFASDTMKQTQTATNLPRSPIEDRRRRMIAYTVAMVIRVICVILCIFVRGWWILLPVIGAVFLPYIAVVLANVGGGESHGEVIRPGVIVPIRPPRPLDDDPGSRP